MEQLLHVNQSLQACNCSQAFSWPQQWVNLIFAMRGGILVLYLRTPELVLWNKMKNTSEFVLKCIWMCPLTLKLKCCVSRPRHASRLCDIVTSSAQAFTFYLTPAFSVSRCNYISLNNRSSMCTIKYIRFINNVLTLVMAKGDAPWDHHGSLLLQEHLCPCHSLWGVKPRCVIAIITHLCEWLIELCATSSVSQLSPLIQLPLLQQPEGSRQMLQMYFLCKTDSNNFSFLMGRVSHRAGVTRHWAHLVCGQKMRCELVASWKEPLGSSGTPTMCSSLKHFVPLGQCSDGFGQNYVLGEIGWISLSLVLKHWVWPRQKVHPLWM